MSEARHTTTPIARELHFYELVGILYRRRRMIVVVTVFGTMLAALVGLLIPPKYTATAALAIDLQQESAGGRPFSPTDESLIDTQVAMLTSRDHLSRVLKSFSQDATLRSPASPLKDEAAATPTDPAGAASSQPAPDELPNVSAMNEPGSLSLEELWRRLKLWTGALSNLRSRNVLNVDQLTRYLNVMQERRSRIVTVNFTSHSPQQAAAIANRIVQLYVDHQLDQKRASLNQELARIGERIAELRKEVESARTAARTLVDQRLGAAHTAAREGQEPDTRLSEFAHDATDATKVQINLLRRQEDIRGQLEFITPDVSVSSLASVPEKPSSPNPILFILPALIICLICASLLAVLLDRLDRGLRSERDIDDELGIPCTGLIPRLPQQYKDSPHKYLATEPFSAYAESIRSLTAMLQLMTPQRASKVILISSSIPMEGKSTLALSLAAFLARLDQRVILVDFDPRQRPVFGEIGVSSERRGLAPQAQELPVAEFIQHVPNFGLDYLAMPRGQIDPLAPFVHQQMPRLLRQLREGRDYVIIDGPPLLGVAESRLLCALADRLLFIVKWGSTRREVAQNALGQLLNAGCFDKEWSERPTAVLTQVELNKHARYRLGDAGELLVKYGNYYSGLTPP